MILGTQRSRNNSLCKLNLRMDGANDGTTFTDSSPSGKAITNNSNTIKTKTATKKFGTASGYSDSSAITRFLSTPDHVDFVIGNNVWTYEGWLYNTSPTSPLAIFPFGQLNSDSNRLIYVMRYRVSPLLDDSYMLGVVGGVTKMSELANNTSQNHFADTFHHLEISCNGTLVQIFLDGIKMAMTHNLSPTATCDISNVWKIFCASPAGYAASAFVGYIDDFRFMKGRQLHKNSFLIPNRAA